MVRPMESEGRGVFVCEVCGLGYATRGVAERCQAFCTTYNACSIEIARLAVYRPP